MRGRLPSGPEFVMKLNGSFLARQRAKVLLETVAGSSRVIEACAQLQICEQRFDQIRIEAFQALVNALEPQAGGRPAKVWSAADVEVLRLKERVAELEVELKAALIRAELAVTLPQVAEVESKKALRSPKRSRRPRSRKRS
jgi:hypothetical protein